MPKIPIRNIYDFQNITDWNSYEILNDIDATPTNPNSPNYDSSVWDSTWFYPLSGWFDIEWNWYTINWLYQNRDFCTIINGTEDFPFEVYTIQNINFTNINFNSNEKISFLRRHTSSHKLRYNFLWCFFWWNFNCKNFAINSNFDLSTKPSWSFWNISFIRCIFELNINANENISLWVDWASSGWEGAEELLHRDCLFIVNSNTNDIHLYAYSNASFFKWELNWIIRSVYILQNVNNIYTYTWWSTDTQTLEGWTPSIRWVVINNPQSFDAPLIFYWSENDLKKRSFYSDLQILNIPGFDIWLQWMKDKTKNWNIIWDFATPVNNKKTTNELFFNMLR